MLYICLLILAVMWICYMAKQMPKDLVGLKEEYLEFKYRKSPRALVPQTEKNWERYKSGSALNFWAHLGITIVFALITIAAFLYVFNFIRSLILPILRYFR